MFDNRWDNWSGDFAESFSARALDPSTAQHIPEILAFFAAEVRKLSPDFPDEVSPGAFAKVITESLPHLSLPDPARASAPEIIALFLEYLRESGRLGEGDDWAAQIRVIARSYSERIKPGGGVKGVPIRKPTSASPIGRNDPCPCGSGKKFKKCCM